MKERTIAEAAIEVLKGAKEPMTAAEITQEILDKYSGSQKLDRYLSSESLEP
ncbi:MAG: HTH domain-containing protein [Cyanobacteria bacterium J06638_22]